MQPVIIIHGGAGDIKNTRVEAKLQGVKLAASLGFEIMATGGSSLDAVEAAVVCLEKDESFNAGYGSVLNIKGEVEMEASVMTGENLDVGAVTLIKDFPHPISIARKVLTDSPHSLLGGEGAKLFALEKGFKPVPPQSLICLSAVYALEDFKKHNKGYGKTELGRRPGSGRFVNKTTVDSGVGTVGAVAIDQEGRISVATSTGGMTGKAVGRIGDTPQIGSGTYADDYVGGVSTTGHGESILKFCLAHEIVRLLKNGSNPNEATQRSLDKMTTRLDQTAGAIALDKRGEIGVYFTSRRMAWAAVKSGKMLYGIEKGQMKQEEYEPIDPRYE